MQDAAKQLDLTPLAKIEADKELVSKLALESAKSDAIAAAKSQVHEPERVNPFFILGNVIFLIFLICVCKGFGTLGYLIFSFILICWFVNFSYLLKRDKQSWQVQESLKQLRSEFRLEIDGPKAPTLEEGLAIVVAAARQSNKREEAIADYAPEILLSLNRELKIVSANKTCYSLLRILPESLIGTYIYDRITSPSRNVLEKELGVDGFKNARIESCWAASNGELVYLLLDIEWSVREQMYFVCARDISSQKKVELARSQYLAMLSHDLGTPLTAAIFSLVQLKEGVYGELSETGGKSVERIEHSLNSAIELVSELIDLEKNAEGKLVLDKTENDMLQLAHDAARQLEGYAERAGVELKISGQSATISFDRKRILRVLHNLITNAVKNSNKTPVSISIEQKPNSVTVRVQDQGVGIPKQLQAAVFDRYYQLNSGAEGHGLGLAVCQAFVQAHSGLINLESDSGMGSTFWFTLPR